MPADRDAALDRLLLRAEAEAFLQHEADLLDARRYRDWLGLLTADVAIWAPIARSIRLGADTPEFSAEGEDANWLDEGLETLTQRVKQLETGVHWAEQPPSRTTRMVANIAVAGGEGGEIAVRCRFLLYRNRNEDEEDIFVGKRNDLLRRAADGTLRLARREIYLDQNVLLAKNLPVIF